MAYAAPFAAIQGYALWYLCNLIGALVGYPRVLLPGDSARWPRAVRYGKQSLRGIIIPDAASSTYKVTQCRRLCLLSMLDAAAAAALDGAGHGRYMAQYIARSARDPSPPPAQGCVRLVLSLVSWFVDQGALVLPRGSSRINSELLRTPTRAGPHHHGHGRDAGE